MRDPHEEQSIPELKLLKAPQRPAPQRWHARARILAAAEPLLARRAQAASSWEVLAAWARPGLVAAALALAVLLGALRLAGGSPGPEPVRLDDVLAGDTVTGAVPSLLVSSTEPDADAVFEMALLERPAPREGTGDERR